MPNDDHPEVNARDMAAPVYSWRTLMPDEQSSPEAMRAAKEWIDQCNLPDDLIAKEINRFAATIDKHTKQKWIKCSERMPTEEDGNAQGNILYGYPIEGDLMTAPWDFCSTSEGMLGGHGFTHWSRHPDDPEPEDAA